MMLEAVERCAPGAPPGAWIDMLYACTATMEQGSFLPCEAPIGFQSTLTRSQSQLVQFLNGGSVFDCSSTPSSEIFYSPLECNRSPNSGQLQPPVMHPNLVCTLKSILSPISAFDSSQSCYYSTPSGDNNNRCTQSGISQREVQGSQQGAEYSAKPEYSTGSTSWPRSRNRKQSLQHEEAVIVPVNLIQNRRPYQCAFTGCQRTFKNPQTMRMHHRTHFTDASDATFLLASSLPLKAGHNKKVASRCPTCYKTFVGLYELRRHFGRKHSEGEKRHACRKCGKRFHIKVDVRDHEKLCGEPIGCNNCGMKFAFKCNLVAHKRSHPECHDRLALEEERKIPISSPPA